MMEIPSGKYTNVRLLGRIVVLKPHGELCGGAETDELEKMIAHFEHEGVHCLVINLDDVSAMNSLGLGVLILGTVQLKKRSARMNVCHVSERIRNSFSTVPYAGPWFGIFPTEEAAITGCASNVAHREEGPQPSRPEVKYR